MFNFVGEKEQHSALEKDTMNKSFFHFDMVAEDYFLRRTPMWDEVRTEAYLLQFENSQIWVPSNYYIMVADVYGQVDWICIDEAIGRPMDILILSEDFRSWKLKQLSVIDHDERSNFLWPSTKAAVPVCGHKNEIILLSTYDQHKHTKDKYVDIFVS